MGFKGSEQRMKEIETKLRRGMTQNAIAADAQERIVQAITSFALYGFPESHAASFALLAYASAYLKCHYLAAFTVCMLNNQPMGFYSPATLVKDAQRHGQRFRPVDIARSGYPCTIEIEGGARFVRLGFNYVRVLPGAVAQSIVAARHEQPFASLRDLMGRVPELNKTEIAALAELGALNALPQDAADRQRRGAAWQASVAARPLGPLLEAAAEENGTSPLLPMTPTQRIFADFSRSGLTIGNHPMAFDRARLTAMGVMDSATAKAQRNGAIVKIAGCVITRQSPGTAKGFVFLSLEDETGIVNVIVNPVLVQREAEAGGSPPKEKFRPAGGDFQGIRIYWPI
jgi:error-prone DNA polymerase